MVPKSECATHQQGAHSATPLGFIGPVVVVSELMGFIYMYNVRYTCMYMYMHTGLEEEYQACAHRREEKEGVLNDARAELNTIIVDVEQHTKRLSELESKEEDAKMISLTHPDKISQLREKIEFVLNVFSPTNSDTSIQEDRMDTAQ